MPGKYPAIGNVEDKTKVRLAIIQGDEIVSAPMDGVGFQPEDDDLTSWAAVTRASGFDAFVATPTSANLAALVTNESGSDKLLFGTPWVTYIPTYTGFGTVVTSSMWSRRIGDSLHIRGKFTVATATAVEARMTLGFNGTNGVITSDATKVPSLQLAGSYVDDTSASAFAGYTLIESNVGYITFGIQSAATAGLTKRLGTNIGSTRVVSITAEIPISGW